MLSKLALGNLKLRVNPIKVFTLYDRFTNVCYSTVKYKSTLLNHFKFIKSAPTQNGLSLRNHESS